MLNTTIAHYKVTAKLGQGGMGEAVRGTNMDGQDQQDVWESPETKVLDLRFPSC